MYRVRRLTIITLTRILATICAIIIFCLGNYLLTLTSIYDVDCPSVSGRVCNDQGTCQLGFCICNNPYFSGVTCSDTMAAGYSIMSGQPCSNRGYLGSPLMTSDYILDECQEVSPTLFNGFVRSGGWLTDECYSAVTEVQNKISTGK